MDFLLWLRTQVLAVQAYPSASCPHCPKRKGLDGGVYVRDGFANRRPSTPTERESAAARELILENGGDRELGAPAR